MFLSTVSLSCSRADISSTCVLTLDTGTGTCQHTRRAVFSTPQLSPGPSCKAHSNASRPHGLMISSHCRESLVTCPVPIVPQLLLRLQSMVLNQCSASCPSEITTVSKYWRQPGVGQHWSGHEYTTFNVFYRKDLMVTYFSVEVTGCGVSGLI